MSSDLDTFELALLAELRCHVVDDGQAQPTVLSRGRRSWLRAASPIAAAVLLAVSLATGLFGQHGSPAYSLERLPTGDIVVTIHRLSDEAALEESLHRLGVTADVEYATNARSPSDLDDVAAPSCSSIRTVTLDPAEDGELIFTIDSGHSMSPGTVLHITAAGGTGANDWSAVAVRWERDTCTSK
jgi:hypothetical protein